MVRLIEAGVRGGRAFQAEPRSNHILLCPGYEFVYNKPDVLSIVLA